MPNKKYTRFDLGVMEILEDFYEKENLNPIGCMFIRNSNGGALKHKDIFEYNNYKNRPYTYTISGGYKLC